MLYIVAVFSVIQSKKKINESKNDNRTFAGIFPRSLDETPVIIQEINLSNKKDIDIPKSYLFENELAFKLSERIIATEKNSTVTCSNLEMSQIEFISDKKIVKEFYKDPSEFFDYSIFKRQLHEHLVP